MIDRKRKSQIVQNSFIRSDFFKKTVQVYAIVNIVRSINILISITKEAKEWDGSPWPKIVPKVCQPKTSFSEQHFFTRESHESIQPKQILFFSLLMCS